MSQWVRTLYVFLGGGLGASIRYGLGLWISSRTNISFPWGTFVINVTGSFLIGLILGWLVQSPASIGWRVFIVVGVLGGYTTFSSFAMETVNLLRERSYMYAASYLFGTCILGLAACWTGVIISQAFGRK